MELGEKIRQARLEAGLSQRQLCGDVITRNMLSLIENGSARPSMDTLRFLAERLGKTVSFFLEEDAVTSPNVGLIRDARLALDSERWEDILSLLKDFRAPDELFDRERRYLTALATLELAEDGLKRGKNLFARQLLEELEHPEGAAYEGFRRRKLLLLGRCAPEKLGEICLQLPGLDGELMLRAREALNRRDWLRAEELLGAAEDRTDPDWNLLRGETHLAQERYGDAAACYEKAEAAYPDRCRPRLEQCYREMGDYRKAYEYACKQKAPS